jgi:hypothetical protein
MWAGVPDGAVVEAAVLLPDTRLTKEGRHVLRKCALQCACCAVVSHGRHDGTHWGIKVVQFGLYAMLRYKEEVCYALPLALQTVKVDAIQHCGPLYAVVQESALLRVCCYASMAWPELALGGVRDAKGSELCWAAGYVGR